MTKGIALQKKSPLRARLLTLATAMLFLAVAAAGAPAQDARIRTRPDVERVVVRSNDGPMIGVTTVGESERADTLGLRISAVEPGSPAEKTGLKAGDRLQAVNGLNLRASASDAGQEDYAGVLNRRLQREVQATKPGESIELRVLTGSAARTVKVTPAKAADVMKQSGGGMVWRSASADRAVLGVTVASTGTVRDTLGLFIQAVTKDGPAEKAGIIEGDRIAAINGVSLRVAREDVADPAVGPSRVERLTSAVEKLKAGEVAELTVVTAGRSRTVRVTTVKASELKDEDGATFIFRRPDGGEGDSFEFRRPDGEGGISLEGMLPLRLEGLDDADRVRIQERLRELAPRLDRLRIRRSVRTVIL